MKELLKYGVGFVVGIIAYIGFFSLTTEKATVLDVQVGTELLMGEFMDADIAHPAGGMFTIVASEGGMRTLNIGEGFHIAHAPDPHVRINGKVIAKVVNYEGAQSYPIPNFIGGGIMDVTIHCEIADVPLAIMTMEIPIPKSMHPDMDTDMDMEIKDSM